WDNPPPGELGLMRAGYWNDQARKLYQDGIWSVNGYNHNNSWGSPFGAGVSFLMGDGSVRLLKYTTAMRVVGQLLLPGDGSVVTEE
ncbi:MAG: DUF1559 domain-containing protein, partial [Gemmataceae bacterium]